MRWLDSITDSMKMNLSKLRERWRTGKPGVLQSTGLQRVGHDRATEEQQSCRLPWWLSCKEPTCQCRSCRFDPWAGKIPWRRQWQPTPMDRGA